MRRSLVGDHVDLEIASCQRRNHLGGIAVKADREGTLRVLRFERELQSVLEVVRADVEILVMQPALDPLRVGLDAQGDAAVQRDGERLRPAHTSKYRGQ